ncbi:SDR family oxidoreductase [Rhodobacterales bacterium HKCCE3408]|nr:SDR family oxidoreductase [Rhodobacterales bacterium HKCCE3408]
MSQKIIEMPGPSETLPIDLTGQRVAISAAGAGIGKTIADCFAERGADVFICDIDRAAVADSSHPGVVADMGEVRQAEDFVDTAIATLGGLDALINNAGIAGPTARIEDMSPADIDRVFRVNLQSMFHCSRRAIPAIRRAGGGSIVNMSSMAGRFGFAKRSPYAAAKWGVIGLTKSMAIELGPDRIRVNAILPGAVEGERVRSVIAARAEAAGLSFEEQEDAFLANSLKTYISADDIANMTLYLCSRYGATISGQALSIDGDQQYLP